MFADLISRSNIRYNQLNLPAPGTGGNVDASGANGNVGSLSDINLNMCIGSSCCNDGTQWDETNRVCVGNNTIVGNTISGFTTLAYANYNLDKKSLVKPLSPTETDNYTFV